MLFTIRRVGTGTGAAVLLLSALAAPATADPTTTCAGKTATIVGTDGDDDLNGTNGADVVSLGDGDDRFDARDGDDIVCGGAGWDELIGMNGADQVYGEDGNDRIFGMLGDDLLDGGLGSDELWDDTMGGPRTGGDGVDELLGGDGDDALQLSSGDGLGGGGADLADGGTGADSVGYLASPVGVVVDVATGTGTGSAVDRFSAVEGPYGGSNNPDVLRGTAGDDVLLAEDPGDGRDKVFGFAGDDQLAADSGVVRAGPGDDVFDSQNESTSDLDIDLGGGDDRATLWHGRSVVVHGGPGGDVFVINEPHDSSGLRARLLGGPEQDELTFQIILERVRVDVAEGEATFRLSRLRFRHVNVFVGGPRADTMLGGPEDDEMRGGPGDDLLRGRGGLDLLIGNAGRDTAFGGPGRDTCHAEVRRSC